MQRKLYALQQILNTLLFADDYKQLITDGMLEKMEERRKATHKSRGVQEI